MEISPDQIVYWQWEPVTLNATLVFSWAAIGLLVAGSALGTRHLTAGPQLSRWQNLLEVIVTSILDQIEAASLQNPRRYLPFVGTLFLYIVTCSVLDVVPGFEAPTASLTTPAALALCVFVAVPVYGIANRGLKGYLRRYIRPSPFMLPFNIIGEVSRTVALAIRLFGNIMSGNLIVAILLSLAPLLFPVVMQAFGLLIGVIQAYVFAVLALVYIASGARVQEEDRTQNQGVAHPSTSFSSSSEHHG
jgi:F-type H+-transporting ATPase subunit a